MPDQRPLPHARTDDHDSPWKEALDLYFRPAVELLAPDLYRLIAWSVPPQFLDKELQSIEQTAKKGRRFVDKLVGVRLLSGVEALLLVHIEVQGRLRGPKARQTFAPRMYQYRHAIQLRSMRISGDQEPSPIYSLGILTSGRIGASTDQAGQSQLTYTDEFLGHGVHFTFPVVELDRWLDRWDELESLASSNPFAVIIMAQLLAQCHRNKSTRLAPLQHLAKNLFEYGYSEQETNRILKLVEWILRLPLDLEPDYLHTLKELTRENKMTYITIAERWATKDGIEKGLQQSREAQADLLLRMVQRRFGSTPDDIIQRIRTAQTPQLETWALNLMDATSLDDVFRD